VTHFYPGDPLQRSLVTSVVSATLSQPNSVPNKKSNKKAVNASPIPTDPLLEVILHDTVIFPEGGGQPTDTGIITTSADGVLWEVLQAKRHGGHAVHYVRIPDGNVDNALSAFTSGASVTVALDQIGSDRRYDHVSTIAFVVNVTLRPIHCRCQCIPPNIFSPPC
jgi:misacylated tRNA(Ala) deacylase